MEQTTEPGKFLIKFNKHFGILRKGKWLKLLPLLVFGISLFGCNSQKRPHVENHIQKKGSPEEANKTLYFHPQYARGFVFYKYGDSIQVVVRSPSDTLHIYYHQNYLSPKSDTSSIIVAKRLALGSTTYVPFLSHLSLLSEISAMSYPHRVNNDTLKKRIKSGEVTDITGSRQVDLEQLASSGAQVIFEAPTDDQQRKLIENVGVTQIPIVEYAELSPLGRAEWLTFFGAICGRFKEARLQFDSIATQYNRLKNKVALSSSAPKVFIGSTFQGKWFAPSGSSITAKLVGDAGGNYIFSGTKNDHNLDLTAEAVVGASTYANFWGLIVQGNHIKSIHDLETLEPRLKGSRPFKSNHVFVSSTGKNGYFEEGILEPQVQLADLISIFHPRILPSHSCKYFCLLSGK